MKRILYLLIFTLLSGIVSAQNDTTERMILPDCGIRAFRELVITGFLDQESKSTSLHIASFPLAKLEMHAPRNLSDALATIPGISQMTTGNAISKPVIRGLYGNRVLVLLSGQRFDNQQWQDEHGLGLSQIGISRVEVIKGPAALLYGTDALGGVVNVIEEKPGFYKHRESDASVRLSSNTLGVLTDVGVQKGSEHSWWRARAGYESQADYSDGHGDRVLNSRNTGYYLRTGMGLQHRRWTQENSYNLSYNQYGFILEELKGFFDADTLWSRAMAGPHHNVLLNILNSKNTFELEKSRLQLNVGLQSNLRQEDEGGGEISLNMHLFSALQNLRLEKALGRRLMFILNQQFTFENNTNYGGRIIIPDANMLEGNVAGYLHFSRGKIVLETGLGLNNKFIETFQTRTLNDPKAIIQPFRINRPSLNGMLGLSYNPTYETNLKWNCSSGFRAPNLAELSSNGLHEGVFRYEIGDPNMNVEQNFNNDLTFDYSGRQWFLNVSGFYNYFRDYVYLAPTDEKFFGFEVFRYRQQNAALYGGEISTVLKPARLKNWQWKETMALTEGRFQNGGYLPFIPAYKLNSAVRWERQLSAKTCYVEPEVTYVFQQKHPAQFETNTSAYTLLNIMAGLTVPVKHTIMQFSLVAKNLLDVAYVDHLSRLKYYGLFNEGLNMVFSTKVTWR